MNANVKSRITSFYGLGGCGLNMLAGIQEHIPTDAAGFGKSNRYGWDTSDADVPSVTGEDVKITIIPGVDGAGKNRAFAHQVAKNQVDKFLLDNPPSELNVLIFSMGGGTGNVLALLLLAEMLRRNITVVCVPIGHANDGKTASNTKSVFASLQKLVASTGKPVACSWHFNDAPNSPTDVDTSVVNVCKMLTVLNCDEHSSLDEADLRNFVDYRTTTGVPANLAELIVVSEEHSALLPDSVTASLILKADDTATVKDFISLYNKTGVVLQAAQTASSVKLPTMYFTISTTSMDAYYQHIVDRDKRYDAARAAQKEAITYDVADNDGLSF